MWKRKEVQALLSAPSAGSELGSVTEVQNFLATKMDAHNTSGEPDFEGLSREQMHAILNARESDRVPLLRINGALSAEEVGDIPVVAVVRWLIEYHGDRGGEVLLTARNNYPRAVCRAYIKRFAPSMGSGARVPLEQSLEGLLQAHDIVVNAGWTVEIKNRSMLTTEGLQLLKADGPRKIFAEALSFTLFSEDWVEKLDERYSQSAHHFKIIQNAAIFILYLLHRYPSGSVGDLFDRFGVAFPAFIAPARNDSASRLLLESVFAFLFFHSFAVPMGLVELMNDDSDRYATTRAFHKGFVW